MVNISHYQRLYPLLGGVLIIIMWFGVFPVERPFDLGDVLFEGIFFIAAILTLELVLRVGIRTLSIGWSIFSIGLLIDLLDEFTTEPDLVDTYIEGVLTAVGLLIVGYGVYIGVNRLESLLDERADHMERLTRQHEQLDQLTRAITHDLKNPLSVAEGRLQLAKEDCESEHLNAIQRALDRMSELLKDLTELASIEVSDEQLEPVDLEAIATDSWESIATANATLDIETDISIRANRARLQQVFENLFRNSVLHGGDAVTVSVREGADGFVVEDDGAGIPKSDSEQIFDRGYSTTDSGTGFGLSIVKQISEAHGWEVSVSESVGGGARFEFSGAEILD